MWIKVGRLLFSLAITVTSLSLLVACGADTNSDRQSGDQSVEAENNATEWDAFRDEMLATIGEQLVRDGLVDSLPTDAEFVRYLHPDEWATVRSRCLDEQGFRAEVTPDGGLRFDYPPEQQEALHKADYRCEVMYPIHPLFHQPLNADQLALLYDYYLDSVKPCLEGEGYEIAEPPTLETFIADYNRDDAWSPYRSVPVVPMNEWYELQDRCPQDPPLEMLYDDQ
jgi:hypothetical protein